MYAGTVNTDGMLTVEATKVPGENMVDAIAMELENTLLRKATIELLVDRISNIFVIAAVALAAVVRLLFDLIVRLTEFRLSLCGSLSLIREP